MDNQLNKKKEKRKSSHLKNLVNLMTPLYSLAAHSPFRVRFITEYCAHNAEAADKHGHRRGYPVCGMASIFLGTV